MPRRLTVAGKGDDIERFAVSLTLAEYSLQCLAHLAARRTLLVRPEGGIETTLAVYAVERAYLAVTRHEINTERYAEAATVYGSEDR
jgi:hypothetical protein